MLNRHDDFGPGCLVKGSNLLWPHHAVAVARDEECGTFRHDGSTSGSWAINGYKFRWFANDRRKPMRIAKLEAQLYRNRNLWSSTVHRRLSCHVPLVHPLRPLQGIALPDRYSNYPCSALQKLSSVAGNLHENLRACHASVPTATSSISF